MASSVANNLFSVAGKNVLVTGGSRGIGLMIASGFLSGGANVLITSRDGNACREAVESLNKSHPINGNTDTSRKDLHFVTSNVSTREGCKALASHASELFDGRLDVLINNAGTSWGEDLDRESGRMNWGWDRVMDLNVKGLFYLTRECIPLLERRNGGGSTSEGIAVEDPGRIVNIGSIAGMIPQEAPTHAYDVSKAAVHHLTKKMAGDLARRGITVNAIAPGYVPSRMTMGLAAYGATKEKVEAGIPLGRLGDEGDMSGAALFLSSRAGAWCTGVILNVDGGACTIQMPLSSL